MKLRFGERVFFAVYIMEQMKKDQQDFRLGTDIEDKTMSKFPLFFPNKDLEHLEGTLFIETLLQYKTLMVRIYNSICIEIPPLRKYKFDQLINI